MSGKCNVKDIAFGHPKLLGLVSAHELAHPQGCDGAGCPLPDLTLLVVFWHEAVVGNFGHKERKSLQDDRREDPCDEAVGDIVCDFGEFELVPFHSI